MAKLKLCSAGILLLTMASLCVTPCHGKGGAIEVGKEFVISPELSSPSGQFNPTVAFDGVDTYLVVWEEGADVWLTSKKTIYATRISVKEGIPRVVATRECRRRGRCRLKGGAFPRRAG